MKKMVSILFMAFVMSFSLYIPTYAAGTEKISVADVNHSHNLNSRCISVSGSEVLLWRVENTSTTSYLLYTVERLQGSTYQAVKEGLLEPGEYICQSMLGANIPSANRKIRIGIYATSGSAEISAK